MRVRGQEDSSQLDDPKSPSVATGAGRSTEQTPDGTSSVPFVMKSGLSIVVDDTLPRPLTTLPATPTVIPPTPVDEVDASKPARTVRFHNRVRITSGVGHSNRTRSPTQTHSVHSQESDTEHAGPIDIDEPSPLRSGDSSASESCSSSISAPLRSSTDIPPRGSLSKMVRKRTPLSNMLDTNEANAWLRSMAVERRNRRRARSLQTDETTPLLRPVSPARQSQDSNDHSTPLSNNKPDPNATHGRWPWRIFSLYYWEAQLTALCCCEADDE